MTSPATSPDPANHNAEQVSSSSDTSGSDTPSSDTSSGDSSTSDNRATNSALAALFCGAIGIAFAPIFVRLSQVGPTASAFWRLALALPALWLWVLLENRPPTAQVAGATTESSQSSRRPTSRSDWLRLL